MTVRKIDERVKILSVALVLFLSSALVFQTGFLEEGEGGSPPSHEVGVEKFSSKEEFTEYMAEYSPGSFSSGDYTAGGIATDVSLGITRGEVAPSTPSPSIPSPGRVSETNVQVKGIDEPDVVKTDGSHIYFSPGSYWNDGKNTKIVRVYPPENLSIDSAINSGGNLLLYENILTILPSFYNRYGIFGFYRSYNYYGGGDNVSGYDVSDPESPVQAWEIDLEGGRVASARLYGGRIYMVVKHPLSDFQSWPMKIMSVSGKPISLNYDQIYYPALGCPVDSVYTAVSFDPSEGNVEEMGSFVGNSSSSIVYMSRNSIYITYPYYPKTTFDICYEIIDEECEDILPVGLIDRVREIENYDISDTAKLSELRVLMEEYRSSLKEREREVLKNQMKIILKSYFEVHRRDIERTGIVKIGLEGLDVQAAGSVTGELLNQFSLDEYEGHLRVATTLGESWGIPVEWGTFSVLGGGYWDFSGENSTNDVYVLNENLEITGSVRDLGIDERIRAVRFMGDRGYVVTYREIDPLFALDLSDPRDPTVLGSLKVLGFSRYLHPVTDNILLGIGKSDDWRVKISLFDVRDLHNPEVIEEYKLAERWSNVEKTHHAFLMDRKYEVFFIPAGQNGYVFSYENNEIALRKELMGIKAVRAVYIDDYLYVVGSGGISVVNENTWEIVNEISFVGSTRWIEE